MAARLTLKEFLASTPVVSRISVKWGDQDAFAHVNNAQYFKYQETGRLRYFRDCLKEVEGGLIDKEAYMMGTGIGPILSDTYCKFKFPLTYPDRILVGSTVKPGDMSKNRYTLTHQIWSLALGRVVSEGFGTVVSYDYSQAKVVDIPEALVQAIQHLQTKDSLHLLDDATIMGFDAAKCE